MEYQNTHTKANLDTKTEFKIQLEEFIEIVDKERCLMLTTVNADGSLVSRPMQIHSRVDEVDFYLFTSKNSQKVEDIKNNSNVNLNLIRDSDKSWVSVSGRATLIQDKELIKKLYNKSLQAWFEDLGDGVHNGGPEDPRIVVLKVESNDIIYELSKNAVSRTVEFAKGVLTGEKANMGTIRVLGHEQLQASRQLSATHT